MGAFKSIGAKIQSNPKIYGKDMFGTGGTRSAAVDWWDENKGTKAAKDFKPGKKLLEASRYYGALGSSVVGVQGKKKPTINESSPYYTDSVKKSTLG